LPELKHFLRRKYAFVFEFRFPEVHEQRNVKVRVTQVLQHLKQVDVVERTHRFDFKYNSIFKKEVKKNEIIGMIS